MIWPWGHLASKWWVRESRLSHCQDYLPNNHLDLPQTCVWLCSEWLPLPESVPCATIDADGQASCPEAIQRSAGRQHGLNCLPLY